MSLSTDRIPNKALTGQEVAQIMEAELREMCKRDYMFGAGVAYKRVGFTISVTCHFGTPHPLDHVIKSRPVEGIETVPLVEACQCGHTQAEHGNSGACLTMLENQMACGCAGYYAAEAALVALERDVLLDNPNVARVSHDLPIKLQERGTPRPMGQAPSIPGEAAAFINDPFPAINPVELHYDKTQYPSGPAPVDRDVSDKVAGGLGLKTREVVVPKERGGKKL